MLGKGSIATTKHYEGKVGCEDINTGAIDSRAILDVPLSSTLLSAMNHLTFVAVLAVLACVACSEEDGVDLIPFTFDSHDNTIIVSDKPDDAKVIYYNIILKFIKFKFNFFLNFLG